jgi:hypothetical protein
MVPHRWPVLGSWDGGIAWAEVGGHRGGVNLAGGAAVRSLVRPTSVIGEGGGCAVFVVRW